MSYHKKYLKYKNKYLELKYQTAGGLLDCSFFNKNEENARKLVENIDTGKCTDFNALANFNPEILKPAIYNRKNFWDKTKLKGVALKSLKDRKYDENEKPNYELLYYYQGNYSPKELIELGYSFENLIPFFDLKRMLTIINEPNDKKNDNIKALLKHYPNPKHKINFFGLSKEIDSSFAKEQLSDKEKIELANKYTSLEDFLTLNPLPDNIPYHFLGSIWKVTLDHLIMTHKFTLTNLLKTSYPLPEIKAALDRNKISYTISDYYDASPKTLQPNNFIEAKFPVDKIIQLYNDKKILEDEYFKYDYIKQFINYFENNSRKSDIKKYFDFQSILKSKMWTKKQRIKNAIYTEIYVNIFTQDLKDIGFTDSEIQNGFKEFLRKNIFDYHITVQINSKVYRQSDLSELNKLTI